MFTQSYSRHESISSLIRCQINRHDITGMSMKALQQLTGLHIPKGTSRIATSGQDLLVRVGEETAAHVWRVRADSFLTRRNVFLGCDRINRDFIVKATVDEKVDSTQIPFALNYRITRKRQHFPKWNMSNSWPKSRALSEHVPNMKKIINCNKKVGEKFLLCWWKMHPK